MNVKSQVFVSFYTMGLIDERLKKIVSDNTKQFIHPIIRQVIVTSPNNYCVIVDLMGV